MRTKIFLGLCVVAVAIAVGGGRSSHPASPSAVPGGDNGAAADGSTLKIAAPPLVTADGSQPDPGSSVVLTVTNVQGKFATFPVTYEYEITDTAGGVVIQPNPKVAAGAGGTTSYTIAAALPQTTRFNWRARATYRTAVGPWSPKRSFVTPLGEFFDKANTKFFDPLSNGHTLGIQRGGHFIPGQGWTADTLFDGIDYDFSKACANCRLEFDVTRVGKGLGNPADLKFVTMGDATAFGDFGTFRNHPWKMHLEQRADGDGTGVHLVWRNGSNDPDGDPGDHDTKIEFTDLPWNGNNVIHFILDWTPDHYTVTIAGEVMFDDGFGAPYTPPNFRISLGCYPRGETYVGAVWSNVRLVAR